jgi:hypothetical protein
VLLSKGDNNSIMRKMAPDFEYNLEILKIQNVLGYG